MIVSGNKLKTLKTTIMETKIVRQVKMHGEKELIESADKNAIIKDGQGRGEIEGVEGVCGVVPFTSASVA